MDKVWLEGVVRNGQVVLAAPLDLPDDTVVIVTDCYELEDDPRPPEPTLQLTGEMLAEFAAVWRKEKTWEEAEQRIQELQARP